MNDMVGSSLNDNSCTQATPEGWARTMAETQKEYASEREQELHQALIIALGVIDDIRASLPTIKDKEIITMQHHINELLLENGVLIEWLSEVGERNFRKELNTRVLARRGIYE
jgi:hypothetical protein